MFWLRNKKTIFLVYTLLTKGLLSLKIVFTLASSADPDEIQHHVTFHLCLHCLPKYLFAGIPKKINSFKGKKFV